MAIQEVVALLIAERDKVNRAIEVLQGPAKRRGRPPKNPLSSPVAPPRVKKRRRTFTTAQRAAQAAKMRVYWAKRKKQGK